MKRTAFWIGLICTTMVAAGAGAGSARADGLPVLGVDAGPGGVAASTGGARYVTLPAGMNTVVARVDPNGGRILGSRFLPGTFTIPAVAYDGSAGGLSGNGSTLVLIRPRAAFPRVQTTLEVLDAKRLQPRSEVKLQGDFSYDAVSPNGSWLYLIQYVSPRDPTRYAVRVYDLRANRLLGEPVTDPRERGEKMRGSPVTRAARCIDLDLLAGNDVSRLRLSLNGAGDRLTVSNPQHPVAVVDTRTFAVSSPTERASSTWISWAFVLLSIGGALAAGGALALVLRRRRQGLAPVGPR